MSKYSSPSIHRSSYPPGGNDPSGGYNPGGYNPGSSNPGGYQPGGYQPGAYPPAGYPQYGQNPGPTGELANVGVRIVAFLIDRFIPGLIVGVGYVLFFVFAIGGAATQSDAGASAGGLVGTLFLFVTIPVALLVVLINEIYISGKNNGQTLGKKLMKIRVAKEDGTPFGYMDAFLRNIIGYWISALVCWLGFFWGLFDSRNQTWHDKIFHTYVVKA